MPLDQHYWDTRYQQNQTGWDVGYAATPLRNYVAQLTDTTVSILIPGCGNAYEAEALLALGFSDITLLDISPTLVENVKTKLRAYPSVKVLHGDFFEHSGQYDLILEQTFFCALDPALRPAYVQQMHRLLKPEGKLVGLLFDRDFVGGPPFGGSAVEYQALFEPFFTLHTFERAYNSIPPRAGTELFINLRKR
jgi:SAM-dependent methyltransferase